MGAPAARAATLPASVVAWWDEEAALIANHQLNPDCKSRLYRVKGAVRGVALLLHGFTAGPWQYDELGPKLAEHGVLGLAVRLVGHGATRMGPKGITEDASDMPKAKEVNRFIAWAERALAAAQDLAKLHDAPLYLVGLSAGGAMALDILRHPQAEIARAVLFAPLVKPKSPLTRAFVWTLGHVPFGDRLADHWGINWREGPPRDDGWLRPGHQSFALGNVQALFRYARAVRPHKGQSLAAPVQIVATEFDDKVSVSACRALAASEGDRHGLYVFGRDEKVPHAMLTAWENADERSRTLAHNIALNFLLRGEASRSP